MKVVFDAARARAQIRATQDGYAAAASRGDLDALVATFARDGVLELGGRHYQGRSAIRHALLQAKRRPPAAGHRSMPRSVQYRLDDSDLQFRGQTEARAVSHFSVSTPAGLDHRGRYLDELVFTDGSWLLARRTIVIEWAERSSPLGVRGRRLPQVRPAGLALLRPAAAGRRRAV